MFLQKKWSTSWFKDCATYFSFSLNMRKLTIFGGTNDINAGASFEWNNATRSLGPVVDIIGTGEGWAKETYGPVIITGNGKQTMVRVTGPGAWKIVGGETIS